MNILIIPHSPEYKFIHNRCHEIGQGLVNLGHSVYFLEWQTCKNRHIFTLIKSQIINLLFPSFRQGENKIKYVRIPILNFYRGSLFFSFINSIILNIFIKTKAINSVINSNINYYNFKYIYSKNKIFDIVDDHFTENKSVGISHHSIKLQDSNIKNADYVTTITFLIAKKVSTYLKCRNVIVIGNGFYPNKFDLIDLRDTDALKQELGITGKFIFGYIGNIDHWVRLELVLDAFYSISSNAIDSVFIIVGGSPNVEYFTSLKNKYSSDKCIFIGPISKDYVANYFKLLDVGLIPFELSDFTNNAFPIKALEYGYAGAKVISSRLSFFESEQFPFIYFFDDMFNLEHLMMELYASKSFKSSSNTSNLSKFTWQAVSKSFNNLLR